MGYLNFVFENGDREHGASAEVPAVNIADRALPSLGKATAIILCHPDSVNPEDSWLLIKWRVSPENVWLVAECRATDSRIKEQLAADQALKQQLADFLFRYRRTEISLRTPRYELPKLKFDGSLTIDEVPPELRAFVDQIAKWERFVAPHKTYCKQYAAQVDEGIYYLIVDWTHFTCSSRISDWESLGPLFDFDPATQPPSLSEDMGAIYWEIPDINLRVAVPFETMIQAFAAHFGVEAPWREYQEKAAERQAAKDASHRATMDSVREELEGEKRRLLDVL